MSHVEDTIESARAAFEALSLLARQAAREWIPAMVKDDPEEDYRPNSPTDDRKVLVFLNGHVALTDHVGRCGGAHGIDFGWYDHDDGFWRVGGRPNNHVTHWQDVPAAPPLPVVSP